MKFKAHIIVMPLKELLDPQGKTVLKNLKNIDINSVHDVRIGKHIEMTFEADDEATARRMVDDASKKLLTNLIMESYTYELEVLD